MSTNETLIHTFYTAFASGDATKMCKCYHPNIQFSDPVFGILNGNEVCQMWRMLLEKSKGNLSVTFAQIEVIENLGTAFWIVKYNFGKNKRKVTNEIASKFYFKDGLIIKHTDEFNIWKWSKQAFGMLGIFLGWTGFFQKKIQEKTRLSLKNYKDKK